MLSRRSGAWMSFTLGYAKMAWGKPKTALAFHPMGSLDGVRVRTASSSKRRPSSIAFFAMKACIFMAGDPSLTAREIQLRRGAKATLLVFASSCKEGRPHTCSA